MAQQFSDQVIEAAVEQLDGVRRQWLRRQGVTAVDVGYRFVGGAMTDELALRVHVERKLDPAEIPAREHFNPDPDNPDRVGDLPVDVLVGVYAPAHTAAEAPREPDDPDIDPRARLHPLLGGLSVGNPRVTAGTLGAIVWDTTDCAPHILSNWHVLAGSPAGPTAGGSRTQPHYQSLAGVEPHYQSAAGVEPHYQSLAGVEPHYQSAAGVEPHYQSASATRPHYQSARIGEPIYQPGVFDGGTPADTVAHLHRLRLDRHMDAAIARLDGRRAYAAGVLGLQPITGVAQPRLGMQVVKSGRSTRVTEGIIDGVSLSTAIEFPHGWQAFDDQVRIVPRPPWPDGDGEVSDGGDSGAVWIDEASGAAVGLHFAGELDPHPGSEHALANPMPRVAEELGFAFTPLVCPAPPGSGPRPAPARAGGGAAAADPDPRQWPQTATELERLKAAIDVVLGAMRG